MAQAQAHVNRGHAQWSASATSRNWNCAGALAMATLGGPEVESIHSARGTAAHEIAERALRSGHFPSDYFGETIKTKEHEIVIDEELVDSATMFVDYVRSRNYDITLVEQNFSLAQLSPPFDAGGTCDAIGVDFAGRLLEVVDLKNGMGVVDTHENKQLRTYALCALLNMDRDIADNIDRITVTIVQPRAPHKDGRIRSETFHIADLVEWTSNLMAAMHRAKQAFDAFEQINGSRVEFDEWAVNWLKPGVCTFCPAEAICPALKRQALAVTQQSARTWFEQPTTDEPLLLSAPALLGAEELGHILDGLEMLESWIKAVRAHAHAQAEHGVTIPGYQMVEKIGNRSWMLEGPALAEKLKLELKLTDKDIMGAPEILSVAKLEKVLGAKRKGELAALEGKLWEKPIRGTNLVSSFKSTRPAVRSKIETYFEKVEM